MNVVRWLFRDKDLEHKEEELDEHLKRVRKKVLEGESCLLIDVDTDFPNNFTEMSDRATVGHVEMRDFYCNRSLDIYSAHCKMAKGAILREHIHPEYDEHIYVISGSIIIWTHMDSGADIIKAAENVDHERDNIKAWNKIQSNTGHRIQSLEDNTHFISKFLKPDDQSD